MIKVRKANDRDVSTIVKIHIDRFSSFFLTTLGEGFLKVFYSSFIKSDAVLLVLEEDNKIRGFTAGSRKNNGFFKMLIFSNFLAFTLQGVKILVTNPKGLKRLFVNANKGGGKLVFAELLSIATEKNTQGFGKMLLEEFEKELRSANTEKLPISLTTDVENNDKAVQFYKDCGYHIHEVFESFQGRKMYRFIKYSK